MVEATESQMRWASALSTRPSLEAAIDEVVTQAQKRLDISPDLGIVFISSAFASEYPRVLPLLQERLSLPALIGCGGGGIVGMSRTGKAKEIEGDTALSLTLAYLPGVNIKTFHIDPLDHPDLDSSPNAWADMMGVDPAESPHFILLADPFSSKINDLLQGLDFAYPSAVKVGGLTSAGAETGHQGLFCNRRLHREGTVGVALSGNIVLEAIVAQGCRPIGQVFQITEGERNILLGLEKVEPADESSSYSASSRSPLGTGLSSRPPLEVLQELIQNLSEEDRMLAQHSLFVGVAQSEFKLNLEPGDFLIRNLLGVDPRAGAIAIGDRVRPGQRIQFHLRDAKTSADDLEMFLARHQEQSSPHSSSAIGALMFSCLGRGEGLYGKPNFDSRLFERYFPQVPLSGFFCNGEIGPVGNSTFLHGYTSVFGIVRPG
ncbi:MAG: FIST N-terminal domain-containing protein [Leptolyngbyaceae bacterium]|nr:FIST N-terminal domain-containing protein [Leptolyngbyaceae bacterium]